MFYVCFANYLVDDSLALQQNAIKGILEPLLGLSLSDFVIASNTSLFVLALGNAVTRTTKDDINVHPINTGGWIVLNTEINVLIDTKAESTGIGEATFGEFVLLDFEGGLEDLGGFRTADCAPYRDLFISANGEGTDSVTSLG